MLLELLAVGATLLWACHVPNDEELAGENVHSGSRATDSARPVRKGKVWCFPIFSDTLRVCVAMTG